jgi:hypothetical protein
MDRRITTDEVDLSIHNYLDIAFTNGKDEIFNNQLRRESDGSAEPSVNLVGPDSSPLSLHRDYIGCAADCHMNSSRRGSFQRIEIGSLPRHLS